MTTPTTPQMPDDNTTETAARLSAEREQEIRDYVAKPWASPMHTQMLAPLLAELAAVRGERDHLATREAEARTIIEAALADRDTARMDWLESRLRYPMPELGEGVQGIGDLHLDGSWQSHRVWGYDGSGEAVLGEGATLRDAVDAALAEAAPLPDFAAERTHAAQSSAPHLSQRAGRPAPHPVPQHMPGGGPVPPRDPYPELAALTPPPAADARGDQ